MIESVLDKLVSINFLHFLRPGNYHLNGSGFVVLVDPRTIKVNYLNRTGKIYPTDFVLHSSRDGFELTVRTTTGIVAVGFAVVADVVGCFDGGGGC